MIHARRTSMLLILAVAMLLLMASQVAAQSHVCRGYGSVGGEERWLLFEAGNEFLSGSKSVDYYIYNGSLGCIDEGGTVSPPGAGWVYAESSAEARALCAANLGNGAGASVDPASRFGTIYICKQSSGQIKRSKRAKRVIKPFVATGVVLNETTDLRLSAVSGLSSGIQFQRVGPVGVGISEVIALGILDAVNVWAAIGGGYTVCFPQHGRVIFLDTAYSPRTVHAIEPYIDAEGYTCADMDRAGTLVLVRDESREESDDTSTEDAAETTTQELRPDESAAITLRNCEITTVFAMRHRNAPAGDIIGLVPADTTRSADARTQNWIRATYAERDGWIAAWLLSLEGSCDYTRAELVDYRRDLPWSPALTDR